MSVTPTTGIITPEAVLLEFRPAGLATRAMAKAVDLFLQVTLIGVVLTVTGLALSSSEVALTIVVALTLFTVVLGVPALLEWRWNGRTPGKAMLGLRVLGIDGGPITFRQAFVRNLIELIELPTGMAVIIALSNARSQRLGDLAGGTFVVSERTSTGSTVPTMFTAPPGLEAYTAALDVSRVDSEQFLLARNFLLRVTQLEAHARYQLAVRLATQLDAICSPSPPYGVQPEYYLICVCAAYQLRHHQNDGWAERRLVATR